MQCLPWNYISAFPIFLFINLAYNASRTLCFLVFSFFLKFLFGPWFPVHPTVIYQNSVLHIFFGDWFQDPCWYVNPGMLKSLPKHSILGSTLCTRASSTPRGSASTDAYWGLAVLEFMCQVNTCYCLKRYRKEFQPTAYLFSVFSMLALQWHLCNITCMQIYVNDTTDAWNLNWHGVKTKYYN